MWIHSRAWCCQLSFTARNHLWRGTFIKSRQRKNPKRLIWALLVPLIDHGEALTMYPWKSYPERKDTQFVQAESTWKFNPLRIFLMESYSFPEFQAMQKLNCLLRNRYDLHSCFISAFSTAIRSNTKTAIQTCVLETKKIVTEKLTVQQNRETGLIFPDLRNERFDLIKRKKAEPTEWPCLGESVLRKRKSSFPSPCQSGKTN